MKKLMSLAVAIGVATSGLMIATPADAGRGWHKHKVCRTVWRNHRRVRRCYWR
jgi:hypothetical protein